MKEGMEERKHYRTVIISDVHIGSAHSKVKEAADFLSSVDCDRLILNGDTLTAGSCRRNLLPRNGIRSTPVSQK